jgi:hypothetical protein
MKLNSQTSTVLKGQFKKKLKKNDKNRNSSHETKITL